MRDAGCGMRNAGCVSQGCPVVGGDDGTANGGLPASVQVSSVFRASCSAAHSVGEVLAGSVFVTFVFCKPQVASHDLKSVMGGQIECRLRAGRQDQGSAAAAAPRFDASCFYVQLPRSIDGFFYYLMERYRNQTGPAIDSVTRLRSGPLDVVSPVCFEDSIGDSPVLHGGLVPDLDRGGRFRAGLLAGEQGP